MIKGQFVRGAEQMFRVSADVSVTNHSRAAGCLMGRVTTRASVHTGSDSWAAPAVTHSKLLQPEALTKRNTGKNR